MKPTGLIGKAVKRDPEHREAMTAIIAQASHWYFDLNAVDMVQHTDMLIDDTREEGIIDIQIQLPYDVMTLEVHLDDDTRLALAFDSNTGVGYMYASLGGKLGFSGCLDMTPAAMKGKPIESVDWWWVSFLSRLSQILECENAEGYTIKARHADIRKGGKQVIKEYNALQLPVISHTSCPGDGSRTVRPHWRRGHIRHVKCKHGHRKRWIHPTIVKGGTPDKPTYRPQA